MGIDTLRMEPRFSEALQGASIGNCYIESGFSGKGQSRLRGRRDIAAIDENMSALWDNAVAVHESSKTGSIYILSEKNSSFYLQVLKDGKLETIKDFGLDYERMTKCGFAEMRFLNNPYIAGFKDGNYAILMAVKDGLYVLDDLDPLNGGKFKEIPVPDDEEYEPIKVGSVCVVANRVIVSEAGTAKWHYSSIGGIKDDEIEMFNGANVYEAEYSNDKIARVANMAGVRLAIFGERTLEIWDISGNPDDPFTTSYAGQVYKIGCIAESMQTISDEVYFAGIEELSGKYAIYSAGRDGLKKLSDTPLDVEISKVIKNMKAPARSGKYAENSTNFYLLHMEDPWNDKGNFTLAFNLADKAFSKFSHRTGAARASCFNCLLSSGELVIGLRGGIFKQMDEVAEHTGFYTEKSLILPIIDKGGAGHFLPRKITIDMQTISTPRGDPPGGNSIVLEYSPDGTDVFIGRRKITIPESGNRKAYPLAIWGLGRCNNLILKISTGTCNFIMNAIIAQTEDIL